MSSQAGASRRRFARALWVIAAFAIVLADASVSSVAYAEKEHAQVFALCYHSFHGSARYEGDVSLADLASQMDELRALGFRFVTLSDVVSCRVRGDKNVLVTIDDGNATVREAFCRVFKPRGIRPLLCIYPAVTGRRAYSLGWDDLADLVGQGCEVASHGYYHLVLNQRLFETDPEGFIREIVLSKKRLEERLGVAVAAFSYPNGVRVPRAETVLRDAGYRIAFTIRWGPIRVPEDIESRPYALCRYMIYKGNWPVVLGAVKRETSLARVGAGR